MMDAYNMVTLSSGINGCPGKVSAMISFLKMGRWKSFWSVCMRCVLRACWTNCDSRLVVGWIGEAPERLCEVWLHDPGHGHPFIKLVSVEIVVSMKVASG
jgi:hypothetical protein